MIRAHRQTEGWVDYLLIVLSPVLLTIPLAVYAADWSKAQSATGLWHCFNTVYDSRNFSSRDKGDSLVKLKSRCSVEWDSAVRAMQNDGLPEQQARIAAVVLAQDFLLRKERRPPIDRKGELAKYR